MKKKLSQAEILEMLEAINKQLCDIDVEISKSEFVIDLDAYIKINLIKAKVNEILSKVKLDVSDVI